MLNLYKNEIGIIYCATDCVFLIFVCSLYLCVPYICVFLIFVCSLYLCVPYICVFLIFVCSLYLFVHFSKIFEEEEENFGLHLGS